MAGDLQIDGQQKLAQVYKDLKRVGDTDLKKGLSKAIRDATKPLKADIKASALANLPRRGGLAALIANTRITNRIKTGSQSAGVSIKGVDSHEIDSMNKGKLRHRAWRSKKWVDQNVTPGWFSGPIDKKSPEIQKAVIKAVEDVARKLSN